MNVGWEVLVEMVSIVGGLPTEPIQLRRSRRGVHLRVVLCSVKFFWAASEDTALEAKLCLQGRTLSIQQLKTWLCADLHL